MKTIRVRVLCTGLFLLLVMSGLISHAKIPKGYGYSKPDSVAALYPKESIKHLNTLAYQLTSPFTNEIDQFRAIYTWVCTHVDYHYYAFKRNQAKRNKFKDRPNDLMAWDRQFRLSVNRELFKNQRTVCTGYAYLIKELCQQAGIACRVVNGYHREEVNKIPVLPNHSWNAVKLNNEWYLSDPTWSSGYMFIGEETKFMKVYNDVYFLADPELFAMNHYPMDTSWSLTRDSVSFEDYFKRPIIYKATVRTGFKPLTPSSLKSHATKKDTLNFTFKDFGFTEEILSAEVRVMNGKSFSSYYPEYTRESGAFSIPHIFRSRGSYTVHILVNGLFISSYDIKVEKKNQALE